MILCFAVNTPLLLGQQNVTLNGSIMGSGIGIEAI